MKQNFRFVLFIYILLFSAFSSGCSNIEFNIEDTIKPPVKENVAVQGTWKIRKYISILKEQKSSLKPNESVQEMYVGKQAIFDHELGAIGSDVCINPEYKTIRTSTDTFIPNKYRISEEILGLHKENVSVVTITTDNQPFYELIVTDNMTAYVYLENGFLVLNKVSDLVDEKLKEVSLGNVGVNIDSGPIKEDPLLRSGVLIGVRSADNTYRTIWINTKNREIKNVSYGSQLLVPRAKGFWEVGTVKDKNNIKSIYAEPFVDVAIQGASLIGNKVNLLNEKPGTKIQFVGNDYIGIEHDLKLSVVPIDKLAQGKGIALSDILNQNSLQEFWQSSEAYIASLDDNKAKNIIKEPNEENFTLKRRNGHWIMKSRFYYKEPMGDKKYEDFDLNIIVSSKLIQYDDMNIPWNEIKSKLPWITDAFMSPNKDIAILVSRDSINIYPVQNKSIINKQLMKIPFLSTDSIVMTEWSIGKYADIWAKFVNKIFYPTLTGSETPTSRFQEREEILV